MIAGVPKEARTDEHRVAATPGSVVALTKAGLKVQIEAGAGLAAGYQDAEYEDKGAEIVTSRANLFSSAELLLQVNTYSAHPESGRADLALLKKGQAVIGFADPLGAPGHVREFARRGVTAFSMELMPRITRAQSMDALSSMATVAGYKAVLMAADRLPRMFPMLMTAAGTLSPARVFVIGAGVAGLQAIATARRLGAVVNAYDVRPAVKEQIESLGAKFVELPLETRASEDKGGYAKAQGEEFYRKQRELMGKVLTTSDVVITTAAIPGKKSPILVTTEMVNGMPRGSVIVDLAAERGGNCELTQPNREVSHQGVTILGPLNIAASIPFHASQMYAKNVATFVEHLVKEGALELNMEDEITRETLMCRDGKVIHPRLAAPPPPAAPVTVAEKA